MITFKKIKRAYKKWKSLGNCNCVECGVKLTRTRAYSDIFCETCRSKFWEQLRINSLYREEFKRKHKLGKYHENETNKT